MIKSNTCYFFSLFSSSENKNKIWLTMSLPIQVARIMRISRHAAHLILFMSPRLDYNNIITVTVTMYCVRSFGSTTSFSPQALREVTVIISFYSDTRRHHTTSLEWYNSKWQIKIQTARVQHQKTPREHPRSENHPVIIIHLLYFHIEILIYSDY